MTRSKKKKNRNDSVGSSNVYGLQADIIENINSRSREKKDELVLKEAQSLPALIPYSNELKY